MKEGVHEQNTIRKNATCIQQHRLYSVQSSPQTIVNSIWLLQLLLYWHKHGNKYNKLGIIWALQVALGCEEVPQGVWHRKLSHVVHAVQVEVSMQSFSRTLT